MAVTKVRTLDWNHRWYQLRGRGATLVTADDTVLNLASNAGDWGDKPAGPTFWQTDAVWNCVPAVGVNVQETAGGNISTIEIIGYGTAAADETCPWILYAYRGPYSPARRVAAGTAVLGTMDCQQDPVTNADITGGFYVDTWGTAATITDYWGAISLKDDAQNGLSILTFDLRGYQFLYLEISPTTGTGTSFGAAFSGC